MLLTIQIILETIGGSLAVLAIIFALVAHFKRSKCFYGYASTCALLTGIVWGINLVVEYFMGIYASAICTALLVCLCLYFGCRFDRKATKSCTKNM